MTRRLQSLSFTLTIAFATLWLNVAHAGKCEALFSSSVGSFEGPVRVAYEAGQVVPFDVQYALVKLSEVSDTASLSDRVATSVVPITRKWARRVLIFSSKSNTAELAISRAGRGWFINTTTTSLVTGKTRKLAADIRIEVQVTSHKLDGALAVHMRAIRNLFRIESAVARDDFIRPILRWVEASGESPLRGNLVELFVAFRHESFHLDRGFQKNSSPVLSDSGRRKMAAIAFLVEERLTFTLGFDGEPPGIFREAGHDQWVRVSTVYNKDLQEAAIVLFQAMANAGFLYESGVYRRADGS